MMHNDTKYSLPPSRVLFWNARYVIASPLPCKIIRNNIYLDQFKLITSTTTDKTTLRDSLSIAAILIPISTACGARSATTTVSNIRDTLLWFIILAGTNIILAATRSKPFALVTTGRSIVLTTSNQEGGGGKETFDFPLGMKFKNASKHYRKANINANAGF